MTVASPGWTFYPSDGCVHDRDKEGYLVRGFLLLSFPFQALTKNDGSVGKYSHDGVGRQERVLWQIRGGQNTT